MLRPTLAATLLLVACLAPRARADCPSTCFTFESNPPLCSNLSSYSSFTVDPCSDLANYNVPNGYLFARASSGGAACSCSTTLEEDFTLGGFPDGTVETIVASFAVAGFSGSGGLATLEMVSGTQDVSWLLTSGPNESVARDTLLSLPVSVVAGIPFRLRYEIHGSVDTLGIAGGYGFFSFVLPRFGSITSCRGYTQTFVGPVATKTETWGKLRATYR